MSNTLLDNIGKIDNLNDPQPTLSRKQDILGFVITVTILSTVFVIGRLWIRFRITHTPGIDDLFVTLAMIGNVISGVILCAYGIPAGLGQHFFLLGLDGMSNFLHVIYIVNGVYNASTVIIKLALLFQYLRVLEKGSRMYKVSVMMIWIIALWGIVFTIMAFVPAVPVEAFWSLDYLTSSPFRYGYGSLYVDVIAATFITHSAMNMFFDLVVYCIPIPFAISRDVENRTRRALIGLFFLGTIVNISSVFRLITVCINRAGTSPTFDPSWYGSAAVVLSSIEINIATVCASLPVFWPIIKKRWIKIMVTHEFEVTTEVCGGAALDEHDMLPLTAPGPVFKPSDSMDETRAVRTYVTPDTGLVLVPPEKGISHSYWLGTGEQDKDSAGGKRGWMSRNLGTK